MSEKRSPASRTGISAWHRAHWPSVLLAALLLLAAYQMTPTQRVIVGSREGLPRLWGFYFLETSTEGVPYRWSGERGSVNFWGVGNSPLRLRLFYHARRPTGLATATIKTNDRLVERAPVGGSFEERVYTASRQAVGLSGNVRVTLELQPFSAPPDTRKLGAAVAWVEIQPASRPVIPPLNVLTSVLLSTVGFSLLRRQIRSTVAVLAIALVPALGVAIIVAVWPSLLGPWLWLLPVAAWLAGLLAVRGPEVTTALAQSARVIGESHPIVWGTAAFVAVFSLALLLWAVSRYHVDVPFWDGWGLVPLLEKHYAGTLTLRDLLAQHNEHRPFFPRLVMIGLARVTHWDITFELLFNVLLAVGAYLALALQICRTKLLGGPLNVALLLPGLSVLAFSLNQWGNWLWGWQMQVFLNVLAVVLGVITLAGPGPEFRWWRFGVACLLGVVATFSFANGILYWVVAGSLLFVLNYTGRRERIGALAIWALVAAADAFVYLHGYHKPQTHPSLLAFLSDPIGYLDYVLVYLGSPLKSFGDGFAIGIGGLGVGALAGGAIYLLRRGHVRLWVLAPYLTLSLYSLASAMMTGVGRVGFGYEQATASRYVTISYLLWVGVLAILGLIASRGSARTPVTVVAFGLVLVITLLAGASSVGGLAGFWQHHEQLAPARAALRSLSGDDETYKRLFPDPARVRRDGATLKELRLSVFRDYWE